VADQTGWRSAVESELRALGRELEVPPASDLTAAVRQRLEGQRLDGQRLKGQSVRRHQVTDRWTGFFRRRRGWRPVLVVVAAFLVVLIATPQGRAAIAHVFRFAGVELRQGPEPSRSPAGGGSSPGGSSQPGSGSQPGGSSLPGERPMSLEQARRQAAFPILVPAVLGRPGRVLVSDGGRVVSLVYDRAPYGQVRMDEFAGRPDQIYFEKILHLASITEVRVNGTRGLWIKGPHEVVYITRDGMTTAAPARLTTGNTLIWSTPQVTLRLEGNVGKAAALTIASSAR
jgi:hypothetical protein